MRNAPAIVVLTSPIVLILTACTPRDFSYTHAVLQDVDGLRVLERSTSSLDSQGRELQFPVVGLPIRSELRRPHYVIEFHTPLQTRPLMFFTATSASGEQLVVAGPTIHRVAPGSAEELEGHFYSFYFQETKSLFVEFTVSDAGGNVLGAEKLRYSVVSRGHRPADEDF